MNLTRFAPTAALLLCANAWADNVTVQATADLYAAGQAVLPTTAEPGGFPSLITFAPGSDPLLTFSVTAVTLGCDYSVSFTADGGCTANSTQVNQLNGLSGITVNGADMFLSGVFLDNAQPSGDGPAPLAYNTADASGLTTDDLLFTPQLGQIFFIGDGLSSNGQSQVFVVPGTASRLFLGFTGNETGAPIFNANDTGSLMVAMTPATEPSTLMMVTGAFLAIASRLFRRCRHA